MGPLATIALPIYALILGVAAVSKLLNLNSFEATIVSLIGSKSYSRAVAGTVVAVEFGVAVLSLIFSPNLWIIGSMAACWLVFSLVSIRIRLKDQTIECSCFGNLMRREVTFKTVAFNCTSFIFLMALVVGNLNAETGWSAWWAQLPRLGDSSNVLGIVAITIGLINSLLLAVTIAFMRNIVSELKGIDAMDATSIAVYQACEEMSASEKFGDLWKVIHSDLKPEASLIPILFTSPDCQFCDQLTEDLVEAGRNSVGVLPFLEVVVDSVSNTAVRDDNPLCFEQAPNRGWPKWRLSSDKARRYDASIPVFPLLVRMDSRDSDISCVAGAEDIWKLLASDFQDQRQQDSDMNHVLA